MTARWLADDEPFFREWNARKPGQSRSLERASEFMERLSISSATLPPILMVVGSKGKGTAVAHASSVLSQSGLKVGTVTSPPFRTNRERIRIGGVALNTAQYGRVAANVARALEAMESPGPGYLSPAGAYTLAGVSFLATQDIDALVIEEGLGGASDEVSLLSPTGVAVTPIFEEHVGVIGDNVLEIAADLLGVIDDKTKYVVSTEQSAAVAQVFRSKGVSARFQAPSDLPLALTKAVPGLGAANAFVGAIGAKLLAHSLGVTVDDSSLLEACLRVNLPGRLSLHPPGGNRRSMWVADAAISPTGVRAALEFCAANLGTPELILASFPDVKDASACFDVLQDRRVLQVSAGDSYLHYVEDPRFGPIMTTDSAFTQGESATGLVLCLGTISFIAEVLDHVDADTEAWW